MSGTPFTAGQLAKLQNIVAPSVVKALPSVAAKFADPKRVLNALNGKNELLAERLRTQSLEDAIKSFLVLIPCGKTIIVLDAPHNPDAYYRTRSGLYVWNDFRTRIVARAKSVAAGARLAVQFDELGENRTDKEIEDALPRQHIFDESSVCAVIAGLIAKQPKGEKGDLEHTGRVNLFYTSSWVVGVRWLAGLGDWLVFTWHRGDDGWDAGFRVFSPAN